MAGVAKMHSTVLDCPDPKELARFYAQVLGWEVTKLDDEWSTIEGADGRKLSFQRAEDYRRPEWPDPERPQQLHLDLIAADVDAAEKFVLELGATMPEHQPGRPDGDFRVYLDPAGHPFCLCVEDGTAWS
ncbi:catechol 2,3-dioxygenase-like lactoylglutathione lyase family enzyme [Thermocatellispora tengchongensis]|uniref:Catechol 2,3-dioxygenase-like lactoylglutathione lyase family enzyme n=1 Tax=Thermocatellispora tengchongensis TaxID=1073253 RepID=A0A840PGP0_9ACTN|nr:VOC family protein [Thermocatellispora tengchongensis]MBB5135205.1 catechol 2,3-dioxygenase-like lactoylglutathione lyase family enzyme [Thermocatellispora tengchongensis]